jgi:cellulose synthase/poly-beta-1,6-N-acetylglucosamine synthase-like glycosyltransferase
MDAQLTYRMVDTALFLIANLVNVLLIGIFLSRPWGLKRVERVLGLVSISLALPLGFAVVANATGGREWWTIALPSLLAAFLVVELILDYILRLPFRSSRLLGPYLLLYYLSLMGMIGYAFLVSEAYGFITLATYFLNLLATWYSYSKVGHGTGMTKSQTSNDWAAG